MPDIILSVESIASADGWFFSEPPPTSLEAARPVACFALVSVTSTEHPTLGANRTVIALSPFDLGGTFEGQEVSAQMLNVMHVRELG